MITKTSSMESVTIPITMTPIDSVAIPNSLTTSSFPMNSSSVSTYGIESVIVTLDHTSSLVQSSTFYLNSSFLSTDIQTVESRTAASVNENLKLTSLVSSSNFNEITNTAISLTSFIGVTTTDVSTTLSTWDSSMTTDAITESSSSTLLTTIKNFTSTKVTQNTESFTSTHLDQTRTASQRTHHYDSYTHEIEQYPRPTATSKRITTSKKISTTSSISTTEAMPHETSTHTKHSKSTVSRSQSSTSIPTPSTSFTRTETLVPSSSQKPSRTITTITTTVIVPTTIIVSNCPTLIVYEQPSQAAANNTSTVPLSALSAQNDTTSTTSSSDATAIALGVLLPIAIIAGFIGLFFYRKRKVGSKDSQNKFMHLNDNRKRSRAYIPERQEIASHLPHV